MDINLAFTPQLPLWLIIAISALVAVLVVAGIVRSVRGAWIRAIAAALLIFALFNPAMLFEEREPLKSVIAIVVDKSGSQKLNGREEMTESVREELIGRFGQLEDFDVRIVDSGDLVSPSTDVSTALFRTLKTALQDVASDRIAGAVLITDGQVHDIPTTAEAIGIPAPVHALITGAENERDRRTVIESAPRFGVVGEPFTVDYRVVTSGYGSGDETLNVTIFIDGEPFRTDTVRANQTAEFSSEVPHGGKNIIEFRVDSTGDEITDINNRAFVTINGIRENLRVLLISGEPHAGERTWRNLLKSDPAVDLVHFTILRPPEKQDGTPINQLSLIAFPTRELFVQKIDEFDLIIFDRYRRRGVLPLLYFENIARYVRDGGALLIAAGPELGDSGSIASPLIDVMPAMPDGTRLEEPYKPDISELGLKHPVTRNLDGWREDEPDWGRWFRLVGSTQVTGNVVMTGGEDAPLLVLERAGEGRVALFLSDHPWLWARGFEGGGPHVQLLRRAAHWLMKEPELDEERLNASSDGKKVLIERQTLGERPEPAILSGPGVEGLSVEFSEADEGLWRGEVEVEEFGLYTATNGDLRALTHVGPPNPREFGEVVSTTESLRPVLEAGRGSVRRVDDGLPRVLSVRSGATASGPNWIGFDNTGASLLRGVSRLPLFAGFLGLALLIVALSGMWAREGR